MTNFLNRMAGRAMGAITTAQPFVPSVFTPVGLARNNASAFSLLDPTTEDIQRGADHVRQSAASEGTRDARLPGQALNPTAMFSDAAVSPQTESLPAPEFAAEHLDRLLLFPTTILPTKPDSATAALRARLHLRPDGISSHTPDQSIATSLGPDQTHLSETDQLIGAVSKQRTVSPTSWIEAKNAVNASPIYSPRDARPVPEAPVIRVSIGRIDVRAEFAAAPPSPAPARNIRPAALSLDEYLKQRSEGRR
ncbi:MAG TPA: hypothetical protein VFR24_10735 [Candidatus Angelobacter sp.]|nr:hypothetical protein [Candidatus Angelobacter sp.]